MYCVRAGPRYERLPVVLFLVGARLISKLISYKFECKTKKICVIRVTRMITMRQLQSPFLVPTVKLLKMFQRVQVENTTTEERPTIRY